MPNHLLNMYRTLIKIILLLKKIRTRAEQAINKKEWDELYRLMTAAKEDDHDLIRAIINHPESICSLATEFQLHTTVVFHSLHSLVQMQYILVSNLIQHFTMAHFIHSLFHSEMLCLKETELDNVFLGPLFIHQSKTFQAYYFLTSQLVGRQPRLQSLQTFGTDGENELIKASQSSKKVYH